MYSNRYGVLPKGFGEEFKELLNKCDNEVKKVIYNKLSLNSSLRELERKKQFSFSF